MLEHLGIRWYSSAMRSPGNAILAQPLAVTIQSVQAISRKGHRQVFQVEGVPDSIGYYFAGFVDGEGSFHLTFRRRKDYVQPWKVSLSLNVSQKDETILALFKRHIQCGKLRPKGGGVWMFEVSNLKAIRENVIPFFRKFGFLSAKKRRDFSIFCRMAELMAGGAHLDRDGIAQLLKLRRSMNDGGKRKYSEEVILEAWPAVESSETTRRTSADTLTAEDDIVRSSVRAEEADRNDRPADSSMDRQ